MGIGSAQIQLIPCRYLGSWLWGRRQFGSVRSKPSKIAGRPKPTHAASNPSITHNLSAHRNDPARQILVKRPFRRYLAVMSSEDLAVTDLNASHIHQYICMSHDAVPGINADLVAGLIVGVHDGHNGTAITIAIGKGRTVTVTASSGRVLVGDTLIDLLHKSIAVDSHLATRSVGKLRTVQTRQQLGRHLRAVPRTGIHERTMMDFTA